jgi:hypothetical protein
LDISEQDSSLFGLGLVCRRSIGIAEKVAGKKHGDGKQEEL